MMATTTFLRCSALLSRRLSLAQSPHVRRISSMTKEEMQGFQDNKVKIQKELLADAGCITKSIFRTCLRSVRLIRFGNERDEEDFKEREQRREQEENDFMSGKSAEDASLGLFSMMPAVDREDELRSRADYYTQYARENIAQEADCLPLGKHAVGGLQEYDVERFMFLLKKAEKERRWLLVDMGFQDPYQKSYPKELADQFEEKARDYFQKLEIVRNGGVAITQTQEEEEDLDEIFDGDEEVPQWILDKYPHMRGPTPTTKQ